tara:strand:+ start:3624 stop:3794 length:171 start_codon:yes stop_codon:yes gene_type:complete
MKTQNKDLSTVVKEVLDRYKDLQPNLASDELRQAMADEIADETKAWHVRNSWNRDS